MPIKLEDYMSRLPQDRQDAVAARAVELAKALDAYKVCKICGKPLSEPLAALALRRFERMTCGDMACLKADDVLMGRLCCNQAEYTACVCVRSYTCPVHGDKHVGSHD